MSDITPEQLRHKIRGIYARNDAIKAELDSGTAAQNGAAYEMLLKLEVPLNQARIIMAEQHLALLESAVQRDALKSET